MTFTANELAAAAAVQHAINFQLEAPEGDPNDECGHPPASWQPYREAIEAVLTTTLAALGVTHAAASDLRWRICFQHEGTREERVAVMGESWVKNQEDRGVGPVYTSRQV